MAIFITVYLFIPFRYLVALSAVCWQRVVLIKVKNYRKLKVGQDGSGLVGSRVSC